MLCTWVDWAEFSFLAGLLLSPIGNLLNQHLRQRSYLLRPSQVMNAQRLALYRARDDVIGKEQGDLRDLALEYSAKTCTEIVQG